MAELYLTYDPKAKERLSFIYQHSNITGLTEEPIASPRSLRANHTQLTLSVNSHALHTLRLTALTSFWKGTLEPISKYYRRCRSHTERLKCTCVFHNTVLHMHDCDCLALKIFHTAFATPDWSVACCFMGLEFQPVVSSFRFQGNSLAVMVRRMRNCCF